MPAACTQAWPRAMTTAITTAAAASPLVCLRRNDFLKEFSSPCERDSQIGRGPPHRPVRRCRGPSRASSPSLLPPCGQQPISWVCCRRAAGYSGTPRRSVRARRPDRLPVHRASGRCTGKPSMILSRIRRFHPRMTGRTRRLTGGGRVAEPARLIDALPHIAPMLAVTGEAPEPAPGLAVEFKWDGVGRVRAIPQWSTREPVCRSR